MVVSVVAMIFEIMQLNKSVNGSAPHAPWLSETNYLSFNDSAPFNYE